MGACQFTEDMASNITCWKWFPPVGATLLSCAKPLEALGLNVVAVYISVCAEQSTTLAAGFPAMLACLNSRQSGYVGLECAVNVPQLLLA
jgi:hypothetical protein